MKHPHDLPGAPKRSRLKPRQKKLLLVAIAFILVIQILMAFLDKCGIAIPTVLDRLLALSCFLPLGLFLYSAARDADFSRTVRFLSGLALALLVFSYAASLIGFILTGA